MANNVLPFIILRTQLEELKAQIALEHKAQVDANVKSTIDTPEIKSIISGVLSRANIELADDISEKVIYEITDYPLFDKPTSREEFLDAFNVAMQFYEKKDS